MKELEKREINISCRVSRSVEAIINSYEGDSIGDKICNMARVSQHLNTQGILEDRLKLMKEIKNLTETMALINKASLIVIRYKGIKNNVKLIGIIRIFFIKRVKRATCSLKSSSPF